MKKIAAGIFWYWNADPSPGGIRRQLEQIRTAGFECVYLHPMPDSFHKSNFFQGMKIPYLGEKYFALAGIMLEECRRLKLSMMLYDEGGWPSGGVLDTLIRKHPECRAVYLARTENGYERRICGIPDLLNSHTTECFIRMTHERYRGKFGTEFGRTIRGIFTDEPFWSCQPGGDLVRIADGLGELVEELYHCSFEADILPRLFAGAGDGPDVAEARRAYLDACSRLLAKNYSEVLAAWCARNHLELEGHFNGEDLFFRTGANGDYLRMLDAFDVPGIDTIWRQIYPGGGEGGFARFASSVAIRRGRREALCECFNVYGYFLTPPVMSWVANTLLVKGINRILPMPYLYSDRGKRKICCGTDLSPRNPIWKSFPALNAFWKWAADFHAGALKPKVWLLALTGKPAPDRGKESAAHAAADARIQKIMKRLDDSGVFWRFANEQDLREQPLPELLVVPFPVRSPNLREEIRKAGSAGVRITDGRRSGILREYAQLAIADGAGCRILPCRRPDGDALMIFNPAPCEKVFRFHSREDWGELPPPDSAPSEIMPIAVGEGIVNVPLAPYALRILSKHAHRVFSPALSEEVLNPQWRILHTVRTHYSRNGVSCHRKEHRFSRLPESGLYTDLEKDFSGWIVLEGRFFLSEACTGYLEFEQICYAAELAVNGAVAGLRAFAPWVFRSGFRKGWNRLRLTVFSSGGNEWRRCFREELEVAGWVNTYAARFKEYEIDDAFCGVSGKVRLLRILDTDGKNLKNEIEDKEWKREEV